jgi:acyl carrier protein
MAETITRDAIYERVVEALVEFGAEPDEIALTATFKELEIDSLDLVELAQIVEDEYGVALKEEDLKRVKTVGDAVELVGERSAAT